MIRKASVTVLAVVIVAGVALALYARSVLASENVRATLESQLTSYFGQPVRIGAAGASIFPRVALRLSDVAIGSPPTVIVEQVSISTGLRGLFSRRIEDAAVALANGRVVLPAALRLGNASDEASAPTAAVVTIASVRTISLSNVEFIAGKTAMRFDMQSALTGDRLDVSQLSATSERTQLEATGALTSVSRMQGGFSVNADPLDLDELLALGSGFSSPLEAQGAIDPPASGATMRLEATIKAPHGRFAGYDFSSCAATLEATPGRVAMPTLTFQVFGGHFTGSLNLDATTAPPQLQLRGNAGGIDVAQLAASAGTPGSITGRLAATVAVSAAGDDAQALLRSARGTADTAITDGSIPGLEMVRTIVLAFGKPSGAPLPGMGSAFQRLAGLFSIQSGVLRSDDLRFASRDFDMGGKASMIVESGAIDARTDVVLSRELSAQAGTDLRRYAEQEGRVIVPAHVTGTLNEPLISFDLAAASRRALENELQRRAKSLLGDLFRRKKGGG